MAVIPTTNVPSIISYYLAIFSFIPFLGVILGTVSLITEFIGLKNYSKDKTVEGKKHSIFGLTVSTVMIMLH